MGRGKLDETARTTGDIDDLSNGFHRVRSRLVDSRGVGYYDFRQTLTPRYGVVWTQLLAAYAVLLLGGVGLLLLRDRDLSTQLLAGLGGGFIFGYVFEYISLFFHAASHYELSSNRKRNDLLANVSIGILFGYPMATYRPTHFDHHRHLGLPEDPEHGYIEALNLRFVLESLTGIRFVKLILAQLRGNGPRATALQAAGGADLFNWVRVCGLLLHLGVLGIAWWAGSLALAVALIFGFVIVSPLLAAIRIVLEHRSESADPNTDYTQVAHGAVSRLFGDGPLADTFGGAGFNRHLLHHWDPQVPYTRLKDLESYLRDTELGPLIEARNTTYPTMFLRLFRY